MIKARTHKHKPELHTPPYKVVLLKKKGEGGKLLNNLLLKANCVMGIL